jgi:hypothetical protein
MERHRTSLQPSARDTSAKFVAEGVDSIRLNLAFWKNAEASVAGAPDLLI